MFKITIKVEHEQAKDDILAVLDEAEYEGLVTDAFSVQVDEVFNVLPEEAMP